MTLFWNELHWYKFCAEASLFQSDYIPSDSPPTASPPCLASGLHQDRFFYLHESYCSTSRCHRALFMPRESLFCSFAFLLAWQPSYSFPPPPSSIQLLTQCGCHAPGFLRAFFSPRKRACPVLTGSVLCCDLPVSGAHCAGGKHLWGQRPSPYCIQVTCVALLQYKDALLLLCPPKVVYMICKVLNSYK